MITLAPATAATGACTVIETGVPSALAKVSVRSIPKRLAEIGTMGGQLKGLVMSLTTAGKLFNCRPPWATR